MGDGPTGPGDDDVLTADDEINDLATVVSQVPDTHVCHPLNVSPVILDDVHVIESVLHHQIGNASVACPVTTYE